MTNSVSDWCRLPERLKQLNQWCIAGADKVPHVFDQNNNVLRRVSVHEAQALHSFNHACHYANHYGYSIGFILTENDPFTCVDLDVKDAESRDKNGNPFRPDQFTTEAELQGYLNAVANFSSYSELTVSGKGLHIWVEGDIGAGVRKGGVELYSRERFIICTGNTISQLNYTISQGVVIPTVVNAETWAIEPRQEPLDALANYIRSTTHQVTDELVELPEVESDYDVYEKAISAANADKFIPLYNGQFETIRDPITAHRVYPSQSEADFSLMSMFTFYSPSNEQCRRLFRMSALGKREKAVKNDVYLNRTLGKIRAREATEEVQAQVNLEHVKQLVATMQQQNDAHVEATQQIVQKTELPKVEAKGLEWPPGMAGAIAGFVYRNSQHPVREVSIVAALGLLAGICGKSFNINGSGLNLYLTLVAQSGVGKEALHGGVSTLLKSVSEVTPMLTQFVDFTKHSSGPALIKSFAGRPSVINIVGEWGKRLKQMADDTREGPLQQIRTVMTDVYNKSGSSSIVGGLSYSDSDKNVASTLGVAYSMMGETTPETYYRTINEGMMEDGFLSRFTTVEYKGPRPHHSSNIQFEPEPELRDAIAHLSVHASEIQSRFNVQDVSCDEQTLQAQDQYRRYCTDQVNSTTDDNYRQMWSRAHLKALRVAALLAVADNWLHPVVTMTHFEWAKTLIGRDITNITEHIESGTIGQSDHSRDNAVKKVVEDYLTSTPAASYKIIPEMKDDFVIPRRYIQTRCYRMAAFATYRLGANLALSHTLQNLIETGYLLELSKQQVQEKYGRIEQCYRVLDLD